MMMMTTGIIIQARLSSSRLPNKILAKIHNKRLIDIVLRECRMTGIRHVVAVPFGDVDKLKKELPDTDVLGGSENDVISRFYHIAKGWKFDPIIRVCADAKMIHTNLILQQLKNYKKYGHIIYGNFCEIFSFKQLEDYYLHDKRLATREHVTLGMIQDMTVDYEIDLNDKEYD